MPGVTLSQDRFTVTQSAINDFLTCPERFRRQLFGERVPSSNDATVRGLTLHAYMEARLRGTGRIPALERARSYIEEAVEDPDFVYVKVKTFDTMWEHAKACIMAFERHVVPQLPTGGLVEQKMSTLMGAHRGVDLWLEGTPDFVDHRTAQVWDWKSASHAYDAWECRNWKVQPTAYTFLATQWLGREVRDFTYAVATVPRADLQIIDVERTPSDWAWLGRIIVGMCDMALDMGNKPWPVRHDTFLCSPKWCPYWDTCRGTYVTQDTGEGPA